MNQQEMTERRRGLKMISLGFGALAIPPLLQSCAAGPEYQPLPNLRTNPMIYYNGAPILEVSSIQKEKTLNHLQTVKDWLGHLRDNPEILSALDEKKVGSIGKVYLNSGVEVQTFDEGDELLSIIKIPRVENPEAEKVRRSGQNALFIIKGGDTLYLPYDKAEFNDGSIELSVNPKKGEVYKTVINNYKPEALGEDLAPQIEKVVIVENYNWQTNEFEPLELPASYRVIKECQTFEESIKSKSPQPTPDEITSAVQEWFKNIVLPSSLPEKAYIQAVKALAIYASGYYPSLNLPDELATAVVVPKTNDKKVRDFINDFIENVEQSLIDVPQIPLVIGFEDATTFVQTEKDGSETRTPKRQIRVIGFYPDGRQIEFWNTGFQDNQLHRPITQGEKQGEVGNMQLSLLSLGIYPYAENYISAVLADNTGPGKERKPIGNITNMWLINPEFYWNPDRKRVEAGVPLTAWETTHPAYDRNQLPGAVNSQASISKDVSGKVLLENEVSASTLGYAYEEQETKAGTLNNVTASCNLASQQGARYVSMYGVLPVNLDVIRLTQGFVTVSSPDIWKYNATNEGNLKALDGKPPKDWAFVINPTDVYQIDTGKQIDVTSVLGELIPGDCVSFQPGGKQLDASPTEKNAYILIGSVTETEKKASPGSDIQGAAIKLEDINNLQPFFGGLFGKGIRDIRDLTINTNIIFDRSKPRTWIIQALLMAAIK
ncbi:MAG: hypothetical protein UT24_C0006G0022 [Candidatus Woesebacteria bacterium GW2011_GWB1_39_12]|uniref:Uncharacterized protein n=2 Tax=Candidatus Woeseibacteriota TaxID=1752722 RepID=A0A0G0M2X5_9BACT|nr:MAG: hypothetical protein UT23_C0010G0023 [Candidatus Woesebacteria bacterium GW2011_GWA1_39_12]KKR01174.1 MAG: hypothetical protein UT24_C0006G0022 [Candidatus Woesebacteria bacterium GW2011_GWB1_39_12]